ncbi:hypothetical protein OOZ51_16760 [Arthrobacter sp. MI7-26]|uniref:hypothetical protein n=1 Tax=Arthrobacter sp. MI7-26 TaxID=2993653 RepID=UPI0022496E60|nr:hypothetical protein [Arthrobacter sp. MI7-26]MCX2749448.1 hypothetical protein [Arthrobacter sp. MI7-26]
MKRTIATMGVVGLGLLGATVSANAAPSDKITICHATHSASNPYVAVTISLAALSAHVADTNDIVPANAGALMPNGQNLTPENIAILNAGCRVVSTPVASPPVDPVVSPPVDPVVSPPVTSPPVDPVVSPPVTSPPVDPVDPVVSPPVTSPPVNPVGPVEQVAPVAPPVAPPVVTRVVPPVVPPVAAPAAPVPAVVIPAASGAAAAPDAAITNVGYNVQTAVGGKADAGIPGWLAGLTGLFSAVAAFVVLRSGVRARKAER